MIEKLPEHMIGARMYSLAAEQNQWTMFTAVMTRDSQWAAAVAQAKAEGANEERSLHVLPLQRDLDRAEARVAELVKERDAAGAEAVRARTAEGEMGLVLESTEVHCVRTRAGLATVRAEEREACYDAVEVVAMRFRANHDPMGENAADECCAAIRARGEVKP